MNSYTSDNHRLSKASPALSSHAGDHPPAPPFSLGGSIREPFPQPTAFNYQQRDSFEPQYQSHQQHDEQLSYAQSVGTQRTAHSLNKDASLPGRDTPLEHAGDCLAFAPPHSAYTLLDESCKRVDVLLSSQLSGLFSREGQLSDYLGPDHGGAAPCDAPVLICYRRNRISVSGHLAIPQGLRFVLTSQGQQLPVLSQELVLCAFESLEDGHGGRLVQTLVQREGPPTTAADSDGEGCGPQPIALTPEAAEEASHDQEYTIFPFDWKKLQFRRATVNNGKGPDRQKFFYVSVKILATLADGQKVSICETSSNPIIVRGRGPQNFVKGASSPEQGKNRSKSVSATLDGRLRKPDRRSTRNSLLRQSLSRRPMLGSAASSAVLQALSAYETSSGGLSLPPAISEAPISPPFTPFANIAQNRESERQSRGSHPPEQSSSPELGFTLPPPTSSSSMLSYSSMRLKEDFGQMLKENFDLPTSGLQIRTPVSPPRPEHSFGGDAARYPYAFNTNGDMTVISEPRDSKGSTPIPLSNTLHLTSDPSTGLSRTSSSHPDDSDNSRITSGGPAMDMAYMDGGYLRDNSFLMLPGISPSATVEGSIMTSSLMGSSYTPMQNTSAWPAPAHNHETDIPRTSAPDWAFR